MSDERCPRCDRAECTVRAAKKAWMNASAAAKGIADYMAGGSVNVAETAYWTAKRDCESNAVDWRARALAAESRLSPPPAVTAAAEQIRQLESERDGLLREMVHLRAAAQRADDYHGKTVRCIGLTLGIDPELKPGDFIAACATIAASARRGRS